MRTVVAEAIGWGLVGGIVAGLVAAQSVRTSKSRGWIEDHWLEVVPVVAAAGAYGIADSLGGSGFIAAFVGGALYGRFAGRGGDPAAFSEELGGLLSGITFIVFGAAVLSTVWSQISLVDVVYAVLSLTVVRMIPVAVAMLGSRREPRPSCSSGGSAHSGLASIVFGVVIIEAAGSPAHVDAGGHHHGHRRAERLRTRHHRRAIGASLHVLGMRTRVQPWRAHRRTNNAGATAFVATRRNPRERCASLDLEDGDHAEHALVGFCVGEDVAMECPRSGVRGVDEHGVPLARGHEHGVRRVRRGDGYAVLREHELFDAVQVHRVGL